jgi:hypothetical protein
MKDFKFDFAKYGNTIPMIEFLDSLSIKERALILKNIEKLIEYKNNNYNLSTKFTKPLVDGIFELKVELQKIRLQEVYIFMRKTK